MKRIEMKIVVEVVFLLPYLIIEDKKIFLICDFFEQIVSVRKKKMFPWEKPVHSIKKT
jgi:hypothetical protein